MPLFPSHPIGPFTITSRAGRKDGPFDTLDELVEQTRFYLTSDNVGTRHIRVSPYYTSEGQWDPIITLGAFYVVTELGGCPVDPDLVIAASRAAATRRYQARMARRASGLTYVFRCGPVPGIHRISGRWGNWLRSPATTQARRAAAGVSGSEPKFRGKRNLSNLPDSYDDLRRSVEHSWKRHRRTQWR